MATTPESTLPTLAQDESKGLDRVDPPAKFIKWTCVAALVFATRTRGMEMVRTGAPERKEEERYLIERHLRSGLWRTGSVLGADLGAVEAGPPWGIIGRSAEEEEGTTEGATSSPPFPLDQVHSCGDSMSAGLRGAEERRIEDGQGGLRREGSVWTQAVHTDLSVSGLLLPVVPRHVPAVGHDVALKACFPVGFWAPRSPGV